MSKPKNPKLWQSVKKRARASSLGSEPGRWSARKAAAAQLQYEKEGGKWEKGEKPKNG